MTDAIEIFQREDHDWGYRVLGENGQIMTSSEGYPNAFNANRGAQALVRRLKDVDKNVIASVDVDSPGAVVDALGMEVDVDNDKVIITVHGPKNKDSYKLVIEGENLKDLKDRLIAAETAVPTKEAYLLSIIERAATYTATPPTIETLVDWVRNNRGVGTNPFITSDLDSEVRDVVVDLFFARKIRTDNKKGLVVVEREGR